MEANYVPKLRAEFPDVEIRTSSDPEYNCHGLTFASRRTGIHDPAVLSLILEDDRYREVPLTDVLPGDVILYHNRLGDIEHSGVVASKPGAIGIPYVFSKWGKFMEVFHLANRCPYTYELPKFYRVVS